MASASTRSDERFTKADRVRKRREYLAIQRGGRKIHLPDLLVFVRPCEHPQRRVGITVSRKVGKAVVRNRIKRLIREVWRRERACLPEGVEVVFVAKSTAGQRLSHAGLRHQLAMLSRRLRSAKA